jgi:hypothetical protein
MPEAAGEGEFRRVNGENGCYGVPQNCQELGDPSPAGQAGAATSGYSMRDGP